MDTDSNQAKSGPDADQPDQDAEPTMTAPEEGRPDALHALKDEGSAGTDEDEESAGAGAGEEAGSPS
ncbi:MAG TPA: hypothetical protein VFJ94_12740 [Intrasporangium sp.]|uniref:hypothetical protein n=1 Tax=Intrasporangium sp. TaxID=1925024 RepID=UPI002D7730E3|nr:hypothetical protein [Intrasporangium sp.]HET7399378.1 hypothetical protein [Intrasporangium sp.]